MAELIFMAIPGALLLLLFTSHICIRIYDHLQPKYPQMKIDPNRRYTCSRPNCDNESNPAISAYCSHTCLQQAIRQENKKRQKFVCATR